MADKWPLATGNWSTAANWNGGTLPGTADDVYADGKVVTIDQNIDISTLRNTQRSGGTLGGNFTVGAGRTIKLNHTTQSTYQGGNSAPSLCQVTGDLTVNGGIWGAPTSLSTFSVFNVTAGTITVNGNQQGGGPCVHIPGGTTSSVVWNGDLNVSFQNDLGSIHKDGGSGNVTITGNITGGGNAGGNSSGVYMNGGILTWNGNITHTVAGGAVVRGFNTATINFTGNIINNATGSAGSSIFNIDGTVNAVINAPTISGSSSAQGPSTVYVSSNGAGNVEIVGDVVGVGPNPGVVSFNSTGYVLIQGNIIDSASGASGIAARNMRTRPTAQKRTVYYSPGGAQVIHAQADYIADLPAAANVRQGLVYGDGVSTGTMAVPAAGSVALGVPVDAGTGTAALTPQAVWDHPHANAGTANSVGRRVRDAATVESTGDQLQAFEDH